MMKPEFLNSDVTIKRVNYAQSVLAGTVPGCKTREQRFMNFVNDIPDAPSVGSLTSFFKRFINKR
ncbi:hypothetical protein BCU12_15265 [Vibrio sp. 10N.261.55.A7]|nr:hypothetical protein BCU12_15265 [Vibrio sp. 10N.261.55.A7]